MRAALALLAALTLSACGTARAPLPPGIAEPVSCVPYARARSGIALSGDAWGWWDAAAGRYPRSAAPRPGGVLVIDRTRRMPQGHVAVVSRVVSAREIRVDHANWASGAAKGRVTTDQPVVDVSARGDWSAVRVWHAPSGGLGATVYPARGFILPDQVFAAR
jgi:hypothetical protein